MKTKNSNDEYIVFPSTIGNHCMGTKIGENFYEKYLIQSGINLSDYNIESDGGSTYNTKKLVVGLNTLGSYIRSQMYDYVYEYDKEDDSISVCSSLVKMMNDETYYECLSNVESLKEMVDEFYEQIKNK